MKHLTKLSMIQVLAPCSADVCGYRPQRKSLEIQQGNNAFVKPVRQDFVRNARLMPGTRCMVLMLMGWAGQEQALETTIGIIAKKLGRSSRQVARYLQDAIEEGYLFYSRTKDRMGYYTGIKIHLNFSALKPPRREKTKPLPRRNKDMTPESDTNSKYIYKRKNTDTEQAYMDRLEDILRRNNMCPN